jgi:RND family efflux transporter MFP subunit
MSSNTAAAAALATAIIAAACSGAPDGPPAGMAFPPVTVRVEPARPGPIEHATEYVGSLRSLRATPVQPQVDGQITQIFVKSGERVAAGARLMQIDQRRQQAAVLSQEAERSAREADVAFARQQLVRARELHAAGAISQQELESAETAVRTADARLNALAADLQQQQVQLRYYTVTAPTSGVLGDVPVRVGNTVTSQTVLTTIDANDALEVHVQVPIERSKELKRGLPLQILGGDGSGILAQTSVDFISPHADDDTQSVLVKGLIRNADGALRSAQYVRARIVWSTTEGLVVPVTAVLRINGQYFAFVAEDGAAGGPRTLVARQRPITVGQVVGDSYAVLSGLKEGDRLIVSGVQKLADGAPITPA